MPIFLCKFLLTELKKMNVGFCSRPNGKLVARLKESLGKLTASEFFIGKRSILIMRVL